MTPFDLLLVVLGAFAGGFVNGLTGFGTGITALPFWLQAMPPVAAAQLVAACSVVGQLVTLRAILHAIDWRRSAGMVVAALLGIPLGSWLVTIIDVVVFKRIIGAIVIAYASVLLFAVPKDADADGERSGAAEPAIGFVAGVLSGLAGLSGVLPTVWALYRGWSKERSRAYFQAFNLPVLAASFLVQVVQNGAASGIGRLFAIALPATLCGVFAGQAVYRRTGNARFRSIVLALLIASGLGLMFGARN